jgi:hypothetical protein
MGLLAVTATAQYKANAPATVCTPGNNVMLGAYVVQVFPASVTTNSLRGRRPWQP